MKTTAKESAAERRSELQALILAELRKEGGLAFSELAGRVADRGNFPLKQVKSAIQYMGQVGRCTLR